MVAIFAPLETAFETRTVKPNTRAAKATGHGVLQVGENSIPYVPDSFDLHIVVIQRAQHALAKRPIDITNSEMYDLVQRPGYTAAAIAVAEQMMPILDKLATWQNVGEIRAARNFSKSHCMQLWSPQQQWKSLQTDP